MSDRIRRRRAVTAAAILCVAIGALGSIQLARVRLAADAGPDGDARRLRHAGQVLRPEVDSLLHESEARILTLDKRIESKLASAFPDTNSHLWTTVAAVLTYNMVVVPVLAVAFCACRLSRAISTRQYILLGNLFNLGYALALQMSVLLTGDDPILVLVETARTKVMMLHLALAGQCALLWILLALVATATPRPHERLLLAIELALYTFAAADYCTRFWWPIVAQTALHPSNFAYAFYILVNATMLGLTWRIGQLRSAADFVPDDLDSVISSSPIQSLVGSTSSKLE